MPIEVTPSAAKFISEMIARSGKANVLLQLVDGGCNGYEYKWTTTDETAGDIAIRLNDNNMLYLDKTTAERMYASIISIQPDGLNQKLSILNPNVRNECGCGLSVSF